MNILKRRKALQALNQYPPVPTEKVCMYLRPYTAPYGLTLTEYEICFPPSSDEEPGNIASWVSLYRQCIPFENIQAVRQIAEGLELYLHTGHLVRFYRTHEKCCIEDYLEKRNPSDLTIAWWYIHGWCIGFWDDLKYRYRHRHVHSYGR